MEAMYARCGTLYSTLCTAQEQKVLALNPHLKNCLKKLVMPALFFSSPLEVAAAAAIWARISGVVGFSPSCC